MLDITKERFLSLAEVARFQGNLVKYAAANQEEEACFSNSFNTRWRRGIVREYSGPPPGMRPAFSAMEYIA